MSAVSKPWRAFAWTGLGGVVVGWFLASRSRTSLSSYFRRLAEQERLGRELAERRALEAEQFADQALARERELEQRLKDLEADRERRR